MKYVIEFLLDHDDGQGFQEVGITPELTWEAVIAELTQFENKQTAGDIPDCALFRVYSVEHKDITKFVQSHLDQAA